MAAAKIRLQNHLKEPFQLPVQPLTLQGWFKIGDREPGDIIVDHQFAPHELAHYKELTENRAEFMNTCKTDRACQSLVDLLALDHRYLTICDALASHDMQPFRETAPPAARSVLRDGNSDDDASGQDDDASVEDIPRGKTPPTPPVAGKKRSQDDNFRTWLPTRPHSVAWNDLGFNEDEAPDRKNFVPACAFFFFIPDLPVKYPDANNALHRHWLTKFKAPMKADDFLEAPESFDEHETGWFNANVESMTERLKEDERAARGLPVTSDGRSVEENKVNAKYGSNGSSCSSAEKILRKRLTIGRACALLGVVMLGLQIPLESAGHQDRMTSLNLQRTIASLTKISRISSTPRRRSLSSTCKGFFGLRVGCLGTNWLLQLANISSSTCSNQRARTKRSKNIWVWKWVNPSLTSIILVIILHIYVCRLTSEDIRFPGISDPQFCLRPDSKVKKAVDYVESKSI